MAQLGGAAPVLTDVSIEPSARPKPTDEQHRAADPGCSVWVSASAGTGKTRVLSNRLLRLLIDGALPANILCLTYTKAGAAEMARRVQDDLARFATLPAPILDEELRNLLGRPPGEAEHSRARNGLFAVLDLPAGLRIMTIHSFCQSLLRRFPLEAGVSPHFELMEPRAAALSLERARDEVLISRNSSLQKAVEKLAVLLGEFSLTAGLSALNAKRAELTRLIARHDNDVDRLLVTVYEALDVEPGMTAAALRERVSADPDLDEPALLAAASALATGTKTDIGAAETIRAWIEADRQTRLRALADYRLAFLTKDGSPRKKLANKGVSEGFPQIMPVLEAEQTRLLAAAEREKAIRVAEKTTALLRVGAAIIQAYERRKQAEGKLDYADLIEKSLDLLAAPDAGAWVRYKLDQRIDHLLIDESQDTSPDQWAIVEALIDDFFSGESGRDRPPTLFVVGDEKQSIFGFQGADVLTYQRLRRRFQERAGEGGLSWRDVPLERSFRSAPAILAMVDAVFADPTLRAGVQSGGEPMHHQAFKQDARGLVEIWPLIGPGRQDDMSEEGWSLPDQVQLSEPAELRLARSIAEQIRRWRLDSTPLANEDRPIEPKDIMILLPRRGVLQDDLVRELQRAKVPVAGADRMILTEELAVMDLMALGDALLLPEDDLTVATVLRSPLFGFSDEELFRLAYDRGERPLYRRLSDLRAENARFAEADDRFSDLLARVDYLPPHDFYARLLSEGFPNGRKRLLSRLGEAAALPIESFLAQAIAFERSNPPSMQGFLHWLRADSDAIKRDAQETRNEVRILTVHGSKGLEAPIVFLADATYRKDLSKDRLLWREDGLPLWKVGEKQRDPASQAMFDQERERQLAEHRRLLYVAMTRAEERLIVAGCRRSEADGSDRNPASWYDMITSGMARLETAETLTVTPPRGDPGEGWRYGDHRDDLRGGGQAVLPFLAETRESAPPIPPWLADAARGEIKLEALRPSGDLDDEDMPAASPLSDDSDRRFGRGLLIHKLLQILPDVPLAAREGVMRRYLEKPGLDLPEALRDAIAAEVRDVLENPAWARLFGPSSRAEVALVGSLGGQRVSGQVDRLAVLDDEIMVIDYKTNRPPPRELADVPALYGRQMALYRALLRQIYPGRPVTAALLWTEGPRLMRLDEPWLDGFAPT